MHTHKLLSILGLYKTGRPVSVKNSWTLTQIKYVALSSFLLDKTRPRVDCEACWTPGIS